MEALITQFTALKTQFLAFEASLNNTIPPSVPDPNNIIDRRSVIEIARDNARADIQERTNARVVQLLQNLFVDNRTEVKRLQNSQYNGPWHSPAKQQLVLIEQEIARIEAERTMKRRQNRQQKKPLSKFEQTCASVRASYPTLSADEVYLRSRMILKVSACRPGLVALNNN